MELFYQIEEDDTRFLYSLDLTYFFIVCLRYVTGIIDISVVGAVSLTFYGLLQMFLN